jgi:hypothetical protein
VSRRNNWHPGTVKIQSFLPKNQVFWMISRWVIHLPALAKNFMKKLLSISLAAIVVCVELLASCTKEEVKPLKDNSGHTERTDL